MFYAFSNVTGLFTGSSTQQNTFSDLQNYTVFDLEINPNLVYMDIEGILVPLPPKPGNGYIFDRNQNLWVDMRTLQQVGNIIKKQRLELLQKSDWTQLSDVQLSTKQAWADYRQQLRDIPAQSGYPFNVIWPTPPQG
jgi:hypothetical protein